MTRTRLSRISKLLIGSIITAGLFAASRAQALSPGDAPVLLPDGELTSGQIEYRQYCASCHGMSGKGNGPVAEALSKSPADLTQLSKTHGGKYPAKLVYQTIDGRQLVKSHGTREMPVWGTVFRLRENGLGGGPPLSDEQVKERIKPIVEFVKSLQQK